MAVGQVSAAVRAYGIAGYKAGDRIGSGVVADPQEIKGATKDYKLVSIDYNLNGQKDPGEDQVMVKLPPKGFIPANWSGPANWGLGKRMYEGFWPTLGGTIVGGIAGLLSGLGAAAAAEAGVLGKIFASSVGQLRTALGVGLAITAVGGYIGYKMGMKGAEADRDNARSGSVPDLVPPKFILNQYVTEQDPQALANAKPPQN
ncbi:MAG: hypothetical protein FJZ01_16375 [Candidatus Sericytochromatia bacterium]|nr:hypothetical protein [Candidatus Tanganyikabacteria bacterium]